MRALVATNLSQAADIAVREAAAIASTHAGELAAIHVLPLRTAFASRPRNAEIARREETVRERLCEVAGCVTDVFVEAGITHIAIARCAERWRADILVVGGGHAPHGLPTGSVVERIVRHADCPVLVARAASQRGLVLAATDLLEPAHLVLRAAADEARRRGARLRAVHAIGFLETEARHVLQRTTPFVAVADVAAHELAEATAAVRAEATCNVLDGRPAAAILRDAAEEGAELIVVGAHRRRGLERLLRGSVSEKVARHATCSVLVVKRGSPQSWSKERPSGPAIA